ncbi:zf-HC2 domain-containing protein [Streptosporangium sp. V21-05]|uniref:zf-HC2 domain-containing protein n=1 Tax=Streptosporangium sp. V21-05 TaxID=3446115 RepID=UPI003F53243E
MVKVLKRFSCEEAVELVTAFMEGELDEPTRRRFEEHLGGCEGCERYLGQFRVTVEALGHLRTTGPPGRLHTAADANAEADTEADEAAETAEAAEADDPRPHTPGTPGAPGSAVTTDAPEAPGAAPGPSRPGSLPEGTRDRLLAAFRARRRTS